MRPTILTFNLSETRLSRLRFLCMKLGCAVKPVPESDIGLALSALCGLSAPEECIPGEPFSEEMLVFCHMPDAAVNRFLQAARQMRFAPVALKAILTPTNADWTPAQLRDELKREREAISRGESAEHEE